MTSRSGRRHFKRGLLTPLESDFIPDEGGTVLRRGRGADYRVNEDGCWIWQRGIDPQGYGRLHVANGHFDQRAHREYYRRGNGPIPAGWHVHHKCHVRACVNPSHLEAISHSAHLARHKQAEISPLDWESVNAIRAAAHAGKWEQELADEYGISRQSIGQIILNHSWVDAEYTPPTRERNCDQCGGAFPAAKSIQRFCSARCRYISQGRSVAA